MNLGHMLSHIIHGTEIRRRRQDFKRPKLKRKVSGPPRDPEYRSWVASLPCVVPYCGFQPCHAAHTGHDGGMRQKSSDYSCVPLCPFHHLMVFHTNGRKDFEARYGVNLDAEAARVYGEWKSLREVA